MGLRRHALDAGVRLFEGTPVEAIEDGAPVRLRCRGGVVTADRVVLATNAYAAALGWKPRAVAPVRVSLFETAPLAPDQLGALGWQGREGVYTAHEILESYRLTLRGTIVGGSKTVRYAWRSRLAPGYDPEAFAAITHAFRERFPTLATAPIESVWGGWIGLTLDFLPMLGAAGAHGNVLYGWGYAGHGVAQATLMGAMLAERVQGRTHPAEAALARKERSWPPEPLRWLGAKLLTGVLSAVDARTDRQIRAGRGAPR
jgi:glycine/D-amino acid oxidase-like deaminating enzyme